MVFMLDKIYVFVDFMNYWYSIIDGSMVIMYFIIYVFVLLGIEVFLGGFFWVVSVMFGYFGVNVEKVGLVYFEDLIKIEFIF